jgi:hypothetical protein
LRPFGWTSADAAGLPILPGPVNYDEIFHAAALTLRKGISGPDRGNEDRLLLADNGSNWLCPRHGGSLLNLPDGRPAESCPSQRL